MAKQTRRQFATHAVMAVSGVAVLSASELDAVNTGLADFATESLVTDIGTDYWRLVQRQFRLEPGLVYLNNASLGPSPALVADATEAFRRKLDAFPSRYMWGGWSEEFEAVRSKAAALLGASAEEIALIHNTTEGMNLVASSLNLEPATRSFWLTTNTPLGRFPGSTGKSRRASSWCGRRCRSCPSTRRRSSRSIGRRIPRGQK